MLIDFRTDTDRVTLYDTDAKSMLRVMGLSTRVPGSLPADDVPRALARLKRTLVEEAADDLPVKGRDEEGESPTGVRMRAGPFVELLEHAAKEHSQVTWRRTRRQ